MKNTKRINTQKNIHAHTHTHIHTPTPTFFCVFFLFIIQFFKIVSFWFWVFSF